jgi:exo-beta-1,3-glucanase (GH17 family)/cellulose synthase/poly-beta-1,6-N-acetylglucosamine synthase-like glycosyltransferase
VANNNFTFVLAIVAATASVWAFLNRPLSEPPWPAMVSGFAYSPMRYGQDPDRAQYPGTAEIEADLALLSGFTRSIRTYSLAGTLQHVPDLAASHGLDVTVGAWLDDDPATNAVELGLLREVVRRNHHVRRVIVGNETLLREDLTPEALITLLGQTRRELDVQIGTAEPWHVWLDNPELANHVDFIAVHLLPYWEGIHVNGAVDRMVMQMNELRARFADKPIVIAEAGWPSWGRSRGKAAASRADAAVFLRRFTERADREGYDYFLMEAFDQPWKRAQEGLVGAHWGVYDVHREPKFSFTGPVVPVAEWRSLAALSALLASAVFLLLVADGGRLRFSGRLFAAAIVSAAATALVWSLHGYFQQYWTIAGAVSAVVLLTGMLGIVLLLLAETHEWVEARWCARHSRPVPAPAAGGPLPKVSIHVPAYREPPEMLMETLRALAELDYPRFEVLVIDNNTADESLWRPVEACCQRLGARFRFFHVAPLEGYKAGALNYALRHTAADADIVAVVDSDYKVDPAWLRELIPHFADPAVAVVQAPQDYRDAGASPFKTMCEAEYRGFFKIGMVTRDDRNAIIQHGTMTMIRQRVLEEIGGWAEWTITEDAELGLRILEHGHRAVYVPKSYGRGLTPDNFQDYKAQRFRWALGAVQILRGHSRQLLGVTKSRLRWGQRYHFVCGWLGWLADGFKLLFNVVAVAWSGLMILAPEQFPPPLATFTSLVLALFAFKLIKMVHLYKARVGAGLRETLGAALAGLALVHIVGRAVVAGLCGRKAPFVRTPKLARSHSVAGAVTAALPETVLAGALLASAAGVAATAPFPGVDVTLWCVLLVMLSVPHLAALALSLGSALPARHPRDAAPALKGAISEPRRS